MAGSDARYALVTGASRGIGRAVALEAARRGYHVVALARSQQALESLDDAIRAEGGAASLVPADLRDYDGLDRLGAALFERWGRLDALAACAGALGALTPLSHAKPAMLEEVFGVNVLANLRLIRSLDPLLRAAKGAAVFVSSRAARQVKPYWGPYAASKAALEAAVSAYAQESRLSGVRAHLFEPGAVRTAMRAKAYPGEDPETLPPPEAVAPAIVDLFSAADSGGALTRAAGAS